MSRHWGPDDELASCIAAEELAHSHRRAWPEGATAGLLLVALSCIAVGAVLFQFAGPRDVVEENAGRR